MAGLRRITALLVGLLFLQLTLTGAGFACVVHADGGAAGAPASGRRAAHAAMHMAERPAGGVQHTTVRTDTRTGATDTAGCDMPGLMGNCTSAASCTSAALSSPGPERAAVEMHAASLPPDRALVPPTRTTAPDHPPPRA